MMKKIILLLLISTCSLAAFGQKEKVKGDLFTTDTADLTILNIYPEAFPDVSVVFKAETRKGEPVWHLTKEKMRVKENGQSCKVISLEQVSKNKPIHIGIVVDHSGSMEEDWSQLMGKNGEYLIKFDQNHHIIFPEGYISPIENAKSAVKNFVSTFNTKKDFISVIGFSSVVDKRLPLTQDTSSIHALMDSMTADSSTALYDAMLAGMEETQKADGIKVLVVLTDGADNTSKSKWINVVDKANKEGIPIYIIGLGNVQMDTLRRIAQQTNGQFYHTQHSNALHTVYADISKQVQAFYDLRYRSLYFSGADSTRQIELSFEVDSIFLLTNPAKYNMHKEVLAYLDKKEKRQQYILYGGLALAVLISAGTLLFAYQRRRRSRNPSIIKKLFPNPTSGNINLEFESGAGELHIINLNGQLIKTLHIEASGTAQFDLSDLQDGHYLAYIQSNGQKSNAVPFILTR